MWMIGAPFAIGYSWTIANDGDATSRGSAPSSVGDRAGQERLARAEVADEMDDGVFRQRLRSRGRQRRRFLGGAGEGKHRLSDV